MLVEQMQTGCAVSVDLGDLGFDVTVIERPSNVLEQLDRLTEMLHSLLVRLLAELVVTLILERSELLFELCEICVIICCCWCGRRFLCYGLFDFFSFCCLR